MNKIIHQIFFSFNNAPMPVEWKQNHEKWKEMHPEYKVVLWNEKMCQKLIKFVYPQFEKVFNEFPYPIQRVDAIRPFLLYCFGGIYIDLDTFPSRNISPLIEVYFSDPTIEVVLSPSSTNGASNWMMMSKKGSSFWILVIKKMIERSRLYIPTKHLRVMYTTGPALISQCQKKYGQKVVIMSPTLTSSSNFCQKRGHPLNFVINQHSGSWNNNFTLFINKVFCLYNSNATYMKIAIIFGLIVVLFSKRFA